MNRKVLKDFRIIQVNITTNEESVVGASFDNLLGDSFSELEEIYDRIDILNATVDPKLYSHIAVDKLGAQVYPHKN